MKQPAWLLLRAFDQPLPREPVRILGANGVVRTSLRRCDTADCLPQTPARHNVAMHLGRKATDNMRGIAAMLSAVFMFSIMDASMKRLSLGYGAFQLSCLRCVSSLAFLALPIACTGSWESLRPANPPLHLVRAVLGMLMLGTFVYAVRHLSMAETYSVLLCSPLLMTALSVPLLGERVPLRRWLTIIIGMGGVLVMLRPGTAGFASLAAGAAAAAACCYALSAVLVRTLGQTNSSAAMVAWFLLLVAAGSGALAWPDWHGVRGQDWPWLGIIGASGALGQYWLTDAFRRAPPAVVAPFEYSALLWAFGIDWAFWSVLPSAVVVCGATIVIGCGLMVIWDERRTAPLAETVAASPPP